MGVGETRESSFCINPNEGQCWLRPGGSRGDTTEKRIYLKVEPRGFPEALLVGG